MENRQMRTLGIIGGMSWVSTLEYYRLLNEGVQKSLGGSHSARILLSSVEFQEMSDWMARGDWDSVKGVLLSEGRRLASAGAGALLIATNTMHLFADEIQAAAGVPVLHIADAAGKRITARGVRTIGLMGTRYSMEKDFYRVRLRQKFGIESLIPDENQRGRINAIIFDELCQGKFLDESRAFVLEAARGLVDRGAQGIVLGCTELPLIVHPEDLSVARFDTMQAHAEDGVRFLLGDGAP
jgi:aspartate racemase